MALQRSVQAEIRRGTATPYNFGIQLTAFGRG